MNTYMYVSVCACRLGETLHAQATYTFGDDASAAKNKIISEQSVAQRATTSLKWGNIYISYVSRKRQKPPDTDVFKMMMMMMLMAATEAAAAAAAPTP